MGLLAEQTMCHRLAELQFKPRIPAVKPLLNAKQWQMTSQLVSNKDTRKAVIGHVLQQEYTCRISYNVDEPLFLL